MPSEPKANSTTFAPVSLYQEVSIATAANPASSIYAEEQKTVRWAFRIRPGVAVRTLYRAYEKLTRRHDSLRLRFVQKSGTWMTEIPADHPVGLMIDDIGHLSENEQHAAIRERAGRRMRILSDPMFEMVLIKCGDNGDVVLMRAHHAIIDGYSIAVLIEELLKIVMHLPLGRKAPSQADFVALERRQLSEAVEEKVAFWQNSLLPLPDDLMIGRAAKGLPPISAMTQGKTIQIEDILSLTQMIQLEKMGKSAGISSYSFLHAAFAETICDIAGAQEILINSVRGRQNGEMAGFVGSDIEPFLVKYQVGPGTIAQKAAWVAQQVAEGAAHLPTTALAPGGKIAQAFKQRNVSTKRFLVHVGTPAGRLANSPFQKLFSAGLGGSVSFGALRIERVSLPRESETSYELNLLIGKTGDGLNATLIADAEGFENADLTRIAEGIRHQLDFAEA